MSANPFTLNLLRILSALLFMQHGAQKLFGWLGGVGPDGGTAELVSIYGLAGILEFFGGALVAIGLFTRPVAAILFVEMMIAYFWRHQPRAAFPIENGGELALLFGLIFLFVAVNGGGKWSVDGRFRSKA